MSSCHRKSRRRRIERKIAHGVQAMDFVHCHATDLALEQTPGFARPRIDEAGETLMRFADRARQADDDVIICLHEAIYLTSQCARLPSLSARVVSRSISTPKRCSAGKIVCTIW